ncbi:hypothetical protein AN958_11683 [Leucoagaricus sp. SymC.cos]|nr:hypothetical protein AN958_11683 [Leucoagaricus sp. SymC.cos]
MSANVEEDTAKNFPQEIFDLIAYHARFDHTTLSNLCLVSSQFLPEARKLLYYELRVSNDGRPLTGSRATAIDTPRACKLFRALTELNPLLPSHVRILYHCVMKREDEPKDYWPLMHESLVSMTNLKTLTIYRDFSPIHFDECSSFQLRSFECSKVCDRGFRRAMLQFLAAQNDLKSLFIVWPPGDPPFPNNICRSLESLAGDRWTIEAILPARENAIQKLTWVPAHYEAASHTAYHIIRRVTNIRILSLGGYHERPSIKALAPYVQSLQVLRLIGLSDVPDISTLRVFVWSATNSAGINWSQEPPIPVDNQRGFVNKWFQASKTLQVAYFQTNNSKRNPNTCYTRWKRHCSRPTETHFHEAEIYDLIIDQAKTDRLTLYNLCLVSSFFLPQARRTLYRDLNISDDGLALCSGWLIDATRAMSLFHTLTEHNPTLSKYVQSFYHRLASHDRSDNRLYWNLLQQTLRSTVNLKRLTITCINPVPDLFAGCSFRLEVFGCDRACDELTVYHATFRHLAAQPDLRSLYAWRLTWIPDSSENILSPPQSLSTEFSNLRVLSLGGYYRRPTLRLIIPFLPSLEVLRLFGETRELNLLNELALIPELASLRVFIWTAGFATSVKWIHYGDFGDKAGADAQRKLVKDWFSKSSVLETAYFHVHKPRLEPQSYLCWTRGEDEPTAVGYEEAIASHDVVSWYS